MLTHFKAVSLSLTGALVLVGCGGDQLGDRVKLKLDAEKASAEFELSDGLELSLAGEFPILEGKGAVVLTPATREANAKVSLEIDLATILDEELGGLDVVTELPNGAPMPVAILPPLIKVPVVKQGSIAVDAAFSLMPELQVGALIHIDQFKTKYFPVGVAICQNFRNEDGVAFAAVCLFGPSADGKPGGVFVGATFGNVLEILDPNEKADMPMANSVHPNSFTALRASSLIAPDSELACMAMDICPEPRIVVKQDRDVVSDEWSEERHDPKKSLKGSNGIKALNNAKKILKIR